MKHLRLVPAFLLTVLLIGAPTVVPRTSVAAGQAQREKEEVTVWVNTRSGVYHCPGSRWYGKTKYGKYMGECEAIKSRYRPAYGKSCGSDCK